MAKLLITGSESFIGKVLIRQAQAAGHTIWGLDLVDTPATGYSYIQADLRDPQLAQHIPPELDAVIHLAAISRDRDCQNQPLACFDVNVTATLALFAATGQVQFIFASTEWVYDRCVSTAAKSEQSPIEILELNSLYAISKLSAEAALRCLAAEQRALTILRFGIVYGPRADNWSAVESLYHTVATQDRVEVGALATSRCFVHVEDIARGILLSLGTPGTTVFNLAAQQLISLQEIIETSARQHHKAIQIDERDPSSANVRLLESQQAAKQLGWTPQISLADGIASLHTII